LSSWLELLLLAIASMFWPTLIVIVVLALRLEHPVKILSWFLVGGLLTTVTVGIVLVFEVQGSSSISNSNSSLSPAVDISMGLLSLLVAYALDRRGRRAPPSVERPPPPHPKKPSVAERAVGRGAGVAFAAGVVLNILPGTFPIVALKDIAQLDASNSAKVAAIIIFYVIMFTFVEVPIVAYRFAPERTTAVMDDTDSWIGRNKRQIAVYVIAGVGLYLIVRGLLQLL
jgi:hypothetical protein